MKKTILMILWLLSACAFSQQSHFYQLQPAETGNKISNRNFSIGIEEVSVPRYLDRPQIIVSEAGSSEMKVSEFDRWADPLSSAIARVVADDMSLYLPQALIKPQTFSGEKFNYTVNIEINKFDFVINGKVTFDAWWTIFENGKNIARGRTKLTSQSSDGFDGMVAEQSRLINEMAEQIARKIAKL